MSVIGLTGMSGAGKSTVARIFAESAELAEHRQWGYVIDCDMAAREVITRSPCIDEVRGKFPHIFTEDVFDRSKARRFLFSDKEQIDNYQSIVFPYVVYAILKEIAQGEGIGKHVLLDAPTLYQSGAEDFCLQVIAIVADKPQCVERIVTRDKITRGEARMRLDNQPNADFFRANADIVIENNGSLPEFEEKIKSWLKRIQSSKI